MSEAFLILRLLLRCTSVDTRGGLCFLLACCSTPSVPYGGSILGSGDSPVDLNPPSLRGVHGH